MQRVWRDLIKPKKLDVDPEELSEYYGKFVAEPFERGFGITIGNALRRILLSSLQGAAVTELRVEGVLHEFSTIPGVKEDVSEIVLNLKELSLKLNEPPPRLIYLKAKGPKKLDAGMIETGSAVEILNLDKHIATVGKGAEINLEMTVKAGRGYVPSEGTRDENAPVSTIFLDAAFSPVERVVYNVTNARVGQRTDYEKLTIELWTNGSIKPEDALGFAAKILQDQMSIYINFDDELESEEMDDRRRLELLKEKLDKPVAGMDLSVRSANCLSANDIFTIRDLVGRTEEEMLEAKNFGRKSLNEIKEILGQMGLSMGMKVD